MRKRRDYDDLSYHGAAGASEAFYEEHGYHQDEYDEFDIEFADPGGRSALRAASRSNPRNLPCPTCGKPNRLTPADRACGYQCDSCADALERGGW